MEEVFEYLRTSPQGLLSEDAEERLQIFGPNRLEEKHVINCLSSKCLYCISAKDKREAYEF